VNISEKLISLNDHYVTKEILEHKDWPTVRKILLSSWTENVNFGKLFALRERVKANLAEQLHEAVSASYLKFWIKISWTNHTSHVECRSKFSIWVG
jgi:hypothetical protein